MKAREFCVGEQQGVMPNIGFGTAGLHNKTCVDAVVSAINVGYRMIDTALLYGNQVEVGEAVRACGVPRESLWVTSKVGFFPADNTNVWMYNGNNVKGNEEESVKLSLNQLGLEKVDLMLIHNPTTSAVEYTAATMPHFFELGSHQGWDSAIKPTTLSDGEEMRPMLIDYKRSKIKGAVNIDDALKVRKESWKALEKAYKEGKTRYIGVSNYPAELLLEMKSYAEIMPMVNEIEFHPMFAPSLLRKVCKELGVMLIGYGFSHSCMFAKEPCIETIAAKHGVSYMQVVERWMIQNEVTPIQRSKSPDHIAQNFDVFSFVLSDADMNTINALNKEYPYYWDPIASVLTTITT